MTTGTTGDDRYVRYVGYVGLSVWILAAAPVAQQSDAATLVAAARQALGGDAALQAVTSLSFNGSFTKRLDGLPSIGGSFESHYIVPDRYLRRERRTTGGAFAFEIIDYDGFNADRPIRLTESPDSPFPVVIPGPQPITPEDVAAARLRSLHAQQRDFFVAMIPLFLTLPADYGLQMALAGKVPLDKGQADAIDITPPGGSTLRLLLDESTHLPVRISWKGRPIVTATRTSTMTMQGTTRGPGGAMVPTGPPIPTGPPPPLPAGDPTAGMPDVDWVVTIRDYRASDGYNWPRRFTTTIAGKEYEDVRVSRYRINPKIDPRLFERAK